MLSRPAPSVWVLDVVVHPRGKSARSNVNVSVSSPVFITGTEIAVGSSATTSTGPVEVDEIRVGEHSRPANVEVGADRLTRAADRAHGHTSSLSRPATSSSSSAPGVKKSAGFQASIALPPYPSPGIGVAVPSGRISSIGRRLLSGLTVLRLVDAPDHEALVGDVLVIRTCHSPAVLDDEVVVGPSVGVVEDEAVAGRVGPANVVEAVVINDLSA